MTLKKMFSKEPVNLGRQHELDILKALPILCLPFIHCIIECCTDEALCGGIPYLFDTIIGGPLSAPCYMFAMGIGMIYTRNQSAKYFAIRGVKLGITAIVLNICRFLIPFLIGYAITGDKEKFITPLVYKVFENDILAFAAMTFLVISLFIKLKIPDWLMFLIALGMSVAGTFLSGTDVHSVLGNIFLGYLIGTEDKAEMVCSYFVFFNWFIVPVSGYIFGKWLKRLDNKKLFFGIFSSIAIIAGIIYFISGIKTGRGMFGEGQNCYYHITTYDAVASIVTAFGLLGLYYFLLPIIPKKILAFLTEVSRNINSIYCIHWIFVIFTTNIIIYIVKGTQILPLWQTLLLSLGICVVSVILAHYYQLIKLKVLNKNEKKKV